MEHVAQGSGWRQSIENFIGNPTIQHTLVVLIVVNALILGLETSHTVMEVAGHELHLIDQVILWIFIAELVLLMAARGLGFFKDPWCVFDFVVIGIALVPATGSLSVLRALRVLRVLRLVNKIESMRKVVVGLLHSLPSLSSVFGLILVIFYVFAVIATNMFGERFPDLFGDLGTTMFTLFQVMTLESWSEGVARPVMEIFPHAWVFFVIFIFIATFVIINLFIAVIVDSLNSSKQPPKPPENPVVLELRALRAELAELRQQVGRSD
ncbi:MAG: ion transporter [Betaproteobacteria bacterium]|nr:ion transporter [Betaproteobacteria bacterium]